MTPLLRHLPSSLRFRLIVALILAVLSGVTSTALLGLSGWFLTASGLAGAAGAGFAFNHLYPSAGVRGFAFGRVLSRYAEQLVGHAATLQYSETLRATIFSAKARSLRGFSPMPAKTLSSLLDDVEAVESGFLRILMPAATVLASVAVAVMIVSISRPFAGFILVGGAFVGGFLIPLAASKSSRKQADQYTEVSDRVREDLSGLVENAIELDVYNALSDECRLAETALAEQQQGLDRLERPFRLISPFNMVLGSMIALSLFLYVSDQPGALPLAAAGALATLTAFDALGAMTRVMDALPRFRSSAQRLSALLLHPDAINPPPLDQAQTISSALPLRVQKFTPQAATNAPKANPLTFTITGNSVTFIKGTSGAGKTTLLESLLRLHPIAPHTIYYGETDAAETRPAAVLEQLAMSPQFEAYLPGTVRDQFRLADPAVTDEAIWSALRMTGLDKVIADRREGLETKMLEKESGFSGGEMRRLSLARALVSNPSVLILDEPFAGLQPAMIGEIAGNLRDWAQKGKRALVIALHEPLELDWGDLSQQTVIVTPTA